MSTLPVVDEGLDDGNHAGAKEREIDNSLEDTPRSEVPPSVNVLLPPNAQQASQQTTDSFDYFAQPPSSTQPSPSVLPRSPHITSAPGVVTGASEVNVSGQIQLPDSASLLHPSNERPSAQTHVSSLSVLSVDSNATIIASQAPTSAPTSAPTPAKRPAFPNQSYAALHSQQYPVRQHAPLLRQRSSHPGQIHTFTSALASLHQSGTRTVGNSPAVTPGAGLFNPPAPSPEEYESPDTTGTYASPFLHPMHRQAPKETHVADVDVDPISGRKLINHYEIIDELGRGAHGKVKLGRDLQTENTHVAIKIVERYSKRRKLGKLVSAAEDKVKKEVAILKKARHPNIVALLEVIDDPTRKKVYIVLEWVELGEIKWRTKTVNEIAIVEARRYARERSGRHDAQSEAEDRAVTFEAEKRLEREKRRQMIHLRRSMRRMAREHPDDPEVWSHELGGDEVSEESEEDRLSRITTATTVDSSTGRVLFDDAGRNTSATAPSPSYAEAITPTTESPNHYLPLTPDLQHRSPHGAPGRETDPLAGTYYGAYANSSGEPSRVNSMTNSLHEEQTITEDLARHAKEILDSDINPELVYVPIMTFQQIRVAIRDTLLGLQYLHYQGIVHRDIKPPNLLSTAEHRVKISDFGVSYLGRPLHEGEPSEDVSEAEAQDFDEAKELAKTVGTPAFYAPELCITDPGEDPLPVTKAIDVWALGITLFCMLFARTPFVDNEFIVMRQIADEEVYIPRKRLVPVNVKSASSRPPSQGRAVPPVPSGRRGELDIVYEPIDDDLYDLLKRLLTKDPRKRITLEEVRHHPWIVGDLSNKLKWLEETDAGRQSQGKKIEISNEDVNTAVVPLQFLERVRSNIRKVGERLGFGSKAGRGRAPSSAGGASSNPSPAASTTSSSSTLHEDHRRQSLRGDEDIFNALKASRHGEHPLARSVAASPELARPNEGFFDRVVSDSETLKDRDGLTLRQTPSRPSPPERSKTIMSTASTVGSMRTLRQSDFVRGRESPPPSPGLPGTPVALQSPGGHGLQTILGSGAARRVMKGIRDRSSPRGPDATAHAHEQGEAESLDVHGEPSLAVSQALAAGHVNQPDVLHDDAPGYSAPNSIQASPVASRPPSISASHDRLQLSVTPGVLSRNNSGGSVRSVCVAELARSPARLHARVQAPESSAADWQRADDERIRKLIREGREEIDRPPSAFDDRTCPPSPDDQRMKRRMSRRPSGLDISAPASSHETSPTSHNSQLPPGMASSSSDFGSAVSMSVSNPSIPSVISEASSVHEADRYPVSELEEKRNMSSDETLNPAARPEDEFVDEGYSPDGDQALDSGNEDEYDSSSDSDGGLVMTRRRSKTSNPGTAKAQSTLDLAGRKERRGTGLSIRSKKSSRSGSNNTMKKVRTRDSEDERARNSLDIREE